MKMNRYKTYWRNKGILCRPCVTLNKCFLWLHNDYLLFISPVYVCAWASHTHVHLCVHLASALLASLGDHWHMRPHTLCPAVPQVLTNQVLHHNYLSCKPQHCIWLWYLQSHRSLNNVKETLTIQSIHHCLEDSWLIS